MLYRLLLEPAGKYPRKLAVIGEWRTLDSLREPAKVDAEFDSGPREPRHGLNS